MTKQISRYTVTFVADGKTVETKTVDYGYTLTDSDYPAVPNKEGYTSSWDKYTGAITQDITVQASYTINHYTVTFVADGETVKTMTVEYGYTLKSSDYPDVPAKEGYTGSWEKYSAPIRGDMTVRAIYTVIPCAVTFVADGETVKTMTVEYGYVLQDSDYPAVPAKEGYAGSWAKYEGTITADVTIEAVYTALPQYTVTFVLDPTLPESFVSGTASPNAAPQPSPKNVLKTMTVYEGYVLKDSDYPEVPEEEGYIAHWNKYTGRITQNITVTATYQRGDVLPPIDPPIKPPVETMSVSGNATEERHEYIYASGKLMRETITSGVTTKILDFRYDGSGNPYAMTVIEGTKRTIYFYITNLQGDVVSLVKTDGTEVASYTYDPYGNILSATGELAELNPLRYRGYYYDSETGFYYLQSRYYDPVTGRFINADDTANLGTGEDFISYNLFTYCFNNPANLKDQDGQWPSWVTKVIIGTAVIATAAVLTVATAGTGTALACFAVGALKGAVVGAAVGAASGAATGVVVNRLTTGSWEGSGQAALEGAANGYMTGAISGFITGGLTSSACFVAGTAVLAASGAVAIENIEAGDYVWAWDEETGDVALKQVVQTFAKESSELVHLTVKGEEIVCTNEHPFYSPVKGWTAACDLRAGDILVLINGEYVVLEKVQHEILESPVLVYNFEVTDFHTYYVGQSSILVHNTCGNNKIISSYNQLRKMLRGTGLQAHHIIEQRFASVLGVNAYYMLSVSLTQSEHQIFTNLWRSMLPYGATYTVTQIWTVAQEIYANYPELLEAARRTIFGG